MFTTPRDTFAHFAIIDIARHDGDDALAVFDGVIDFPAAHLRLNGVRSQNKDKAVLTLDT